MRPHFRLRGLRAAQLTIAGLMLVAPASALALSSGHPARAGSTGARGSAGSVSAHVSPRRVTLGHPVRVRGRAGAGATVELQAARPGGDAWHRVASTHAGRRGGWAVRTHLSESSIVRAVQTVVTASRAHVSGGPTAPVGRHPVAVSRATRVQVRAQLRVAADEHRAIVGRQAAVAGRLLPARAGRVVAVQAHSGSGWHTVGRGRTGARGGFHARFDPPAGAERGLRVVFAGDRLNERATGGAGTLTLYSPVVVSWYDDAGSTACGFHATDGVASRTLPCGTKVRFRRGGRSVTATVDDRGPYVGGREFDLNQNTAGALGFAGVGTVEASIG